MGKGTPGFNAFSSLAPSAQKMAVEHQMKQAYKRNLKARIVGNIPPGGGALLYLVTHEPKAIELSSVPQQMIFRHLGLAGLGLDPVLIKEEFQSRPGMYATAPGTLKIVERFIWLREHQLDVWG